MNITARKTLDRTEQRLIAVLQTGGSDREGFTLNANSLNGAASEYRFEFAADQHSEWMVDLHEAIKKNANILLNDIRDK